MLKTTQLLDLALRMFGTNNNKTFSNSRSDRANKMVKILSQFKKSKNNKSEKLIMVSF